MFRDRVLEQDCNKLLASRSFPVLRLRFKVSHQSIRCGMATFKDKAFNLACVLPSENQGFQVLSRRFAGKSLLVDPALRPA